MEVIIPPCSSNNQISKDIYAFLQKQGNSIPISLIKNNHYSQSGGGGFYDYFSRFMNGQDQDQQEQKTQTNYQEQQKQTQTNDQEQQKQTQKQEQGLLDHEKKTTTNNNYILLEFHDKKHTLENIKGTKLYFLISRNGNDECARWV